MNREDRSFLSWTTFAVAIAALVVGFIALARARDDADELAAGAENAAAEVTTLDLGLGALELEPEHLTAPAGHVQLRVTNTDTQVHNVVVAGAQSKDLQPGESELLDLGVLGVGEYEMHCDISGHAQAGMTGTLHVVADGVDSDTNGVAAADTEADYFHGHDSWEAMETAMTERALRYVEEEKGEFGGQPLEPTIMDDGTKQFEVTAEIVDWEVEPGVVVQAWTYNGTVPAPSMHVEVGDKVRVILDNQLPTATTIHWHGIRVPNEMDGVPPYTQEAVAPGATFTYEFEALEPAVGIYHSHNGADQVLDGLFGVFTIDEMQVPDVLIEQGFKETPDQTINMILNDAGVIGLTLNGKGFPATEIYSAKVGDTVQVHYYNEGLMAHPMHLHQPLGWIIAKDGKELLQPIPGDTINIAPGERYTVLYQMVDPGVWAWHCHILTHAERADGMFGMVTAMIVEP